MSCFTLPLMLSAAVPLEIEQLRRRGGPTATDLAGLKCMVQRLAERGDVLLYGGPEGEPAMLFADLVRALAVAAFQPGGIQAFGEHWEATA